MADEHLLSIYEVTNDNRRERADAKESLKRLAAVAQRSSDWHVVLRDGHCHQAVLAFVHHLASTTQSAVAAEPDFVLPLLPSGAGHSQPTQVAPQEAKEIYEEYAASVSCAVCHSGAPPAVTPESDKDAPEWPPVVAPVWPFQFSAQLSGSGTKDNMTLNGSWHYDFPKNRMVQYFSASGFNMTQVWLANPAPPGEGDAEQVYGPGAKRGVMYIFTQPYPFAPTTCSMLPYALSVPHPDAFSSQLIGSENVKFAGRKRIEGGRGEVWTDHYTYFLNMSAGSPCNGLFEVWMDINDGIPLMDYGPTGCDDNKARVKYWDFQRAEPPSWHFTAHNFTACKPRSVEELQSLLLQQAATYSQAMGDNSNTLQSAIYASMSNVARSTFGIATSANAATNMEFLV